ncbi:MAG TPA: MaoC/PaaZ C-terminal domain-containing protein [Candidatus Baltobacteraceae bacterium]|nr:MaoC/PaaZ C-terminal domain-containing protein [Candidatus Baltobacteraceae bacterium]
MVVGEEFESPARTVSETDIVNFSALSGDWSPVHSDEEYCRQTPYKTRIAHGLFGLAVAEGLKFRIPEFSGARYVASLFWNYKFTGPILMGDTIRVRVKVQSKRETKKSDRGIVVEYVTMLNQRNEVVQEGEHGLMIWRRPTQ